MKNIIIYSEGKSATAEQYLQNNDDYIVVIKDVAEIKNTDEIEPSAIIVECETDEAVKNLVMTHKFQAPVLLVLDKPVEGLKVRTDAFDYVLKPIIKDELQNRLNNLIKISELKEEINTVSSTDELTGLHNRRYVHERLEAEISRAKRYGFKLSCLLIDIDFFKVINDMYGYDWGDILLKRIAEMLQNLIRKEDVLTRYGDEEFLIVLPNTDEENAFIFAERFRRDIEKMQFIPDKEEEPHPITISGGIASYPFLENVEENANTLIRYAEHALYNAKKRGKNKIVQFSQINLEF